MVLLKGGTHFYRWSSVEITLMVSFRLSLFGRHGHLSGTDTIHPMQDPELGLETFTSITVSQISLVSYIVFSTKKKLFVSLSRHLSLARKKFHTEKTEISPLFV